MRRFLRFLPHLCVAFNVTLLVVAILDHINPMVDLMRGGLFIALLLCCVLSSLVTAYSLIARRGWRWR